MVFLFVIAGALFLLSQQIGGFRAFVITSSSMEPVISTGSLIITHTNHPTLLKKNDIVTFIRPDNTHELITHRIQKILKKGTLVTLQTKGDNNKNADPWIVAGGGVIGKEFFAIPYLGYFFAFTKTTLGLIVVIVLPALLLIYNEVRTIFSLVKQSRIEKTPTAVLPILLLIGSSLLFISPSFALVSDSASLINIQLNTQISHSHIVISDISYTGDEWVELYNPTDNDVSLKDWTLTDNSGIAVAIHANKTIAAKGFVVIAKDHSFFHKTEIDIIETGHDFGDGLDDTGDTVILNDATGIEVDRKSWGGQ